MFLEIHRCMVRLSMLLCHSLCIHAFVLKWYMTRVPYGIPLQYYPPTVNIPPSKSNKLLSQISTNKAQTVGCKISSQKSSRSSSNYGCKITQNQQHQQDEAPGVPLIEGIHRSVRRLRIYLDEENKSQG